MFNFALGFLSATLFAGFCPEPFTKFKTWITESVHKLNK